MRTVDTVIESMKNNPEQWSLCPYYLTHESGIEIWVTNGFFFYQIRQTVTFSFFDKIKFAIAFNRFRQDYYSALLKS